MKAHYLRAGMTHYYQEDYQKAIAYLNQAIWLNNIIPMTFFFRGVAYYRLGNFHKARDDFQKTIELDPTWKAANIYMEIITTELVDEIQIKPETKEVGEAEEDFHIASSDAE
jgi:tetratricopeptide (TPR) repeat protein